MPPNPTLAAALEWARLGLHVLPIVPGTKRPPFRTGEGHSAATTDPELIERWFSVGDYWLALVLHLSGHCAADVDIRPGSNAAADQLVQLERLTGHSMRRRWSDVTACQTTPQRGWHYIFTRPAGVTREELRKNLTANIELQQQILVMAPSKGRRTVTRACNVGFAELFPELVEIAKRPIRARPSTSTEAGAAGNVGSISSLHRFVKRLEEGNRNKGYHWACCRAAEMLEQGAISEQNAAYLIETAVSIGLERREAEGTYASAMRHLDLAGPVHRPRPREAPAGQAETTAETPAETTSWYVMVPTALHNSDLSVTDLGLYLKMATGWDLRTRTYTSTITDLAKVAKLGRVTTLRALRRLREHGLIDYQAQQGSHDPTVFQIADARHPTATALFFSLKGPRSEHEATPSEGAPINGSEAIGADDVNMAHGSEMNMKTSVVNMRTSAVTDSELEFLAAIQVEIDTGVLHEIARTAHCPYPQHREHDWTDSTSQKSHCGICHPPAYATPPYAPGGGLPAVSLDGVAGTGTYDARRGSAP
jgi:hypothetical protein